MLVIYLTLDFLLFFYISENRLLYIFSIQSLISYLTIIPTFIVSIGVPLNDKVKTAFLFCRVFRLFSIFRLDKFFARRNLNLVRVYFRLIYIFVATIMIFAAAML